MDDNILQRLEGMTLKEEEGGFLNLEDPYVNDVVHEDELRVFLHIHGVNLSI